MSKNELRKSMPNGAAIVRSVGFVNRIRREVNLEETSQKYGIDREMKDNSRIEFGQNIDKCANNGTY